MEPVYLYSLVSMGGLAAILAAGLGFAAKTFKVERDERIDRLENILPGANCGGCGYAGCASYAEAIVKDGAPLNACSVGGEKVAKKIAAVMGTKASTAERQIAQVLCHGGLKETRRPAEYQGIKSCKAASLVVGGTKSCQYGCLGFGDCVAVCPFDAITMNDNGLPEIDSDKCTACGTCVKACPKGIITLAPISSKNQIRCSSHEPGKEVRKICEIGCIGCGICAKSCPVEAITIEDNLAVIDYSKCINCGLCAEKCPTGVIEFKGKRITEIRITDKCVGCTLCAKKCPVEAIDGELKEKHEINPEKCIRCGICYDTCKVGAIEVKYND